MLVLSRKKNEAIRIDDDIVIYVVEIDQHRERVRLGIEAPRETTIHRQEVYEAIQRDRDAEATE